MHVYVGSCLRTFLHQLLFLQKSSFDPFFSVGILGCETKCGQESMSDGSVTETQLFPGEKLLRGKRLFFPQKII